MRRATPIAVLLGLLGVLGLLATSAEGATPLVQRTIPGLGLSIGVPSGWKALDYRQVLTSDVVDRFAKENPGLASLLQALRDPNSGVRFFAVDLHMTNGFATNVNLTVETIPSGITPKVYAAVATKQLQTLPNVVRPIRSQALDLPAGPSVRLRYALRLSAGGRKIVTSVTQYVLVRTTQAFVGTYSTLPTLTPKLAPVFEASARSIKLKR